MQLVVRACLIFILTTNLSFNHTLIRFQKRIIFKKDIFRKPVSYMKTIKTIGLILFIIALGVFTFSLFMSEHTLSESLVKAQVVHPQPNVMTAHQTAIINSSTEILGKTYSTNISYIGALKEALRSAQSTLSNTDTKIENWQLDNYLFDLTRHSSPGPFKGNSLLTFWLSFILGSIGALIYFLPDLKLIPGIKNNGIYHSSFTRGIDWKLRAFLVAGALLTAILFALFQNMWLLIGLLATIGFIAWTLYQRRKKYYGSESARSASPENNNGWMGIATGAYLIGFYILLYFYPHYITNWIHIVDPVSEFISGNPASQWFLYGLLYCFVMLIMGIRMFIKYRHNKYQLVRTFSVIFFQLGFAFLIPEIMVRLNQPYMDLKNAWPLDYDFFTQDQITKLVGQGSSFEVLGMSTSVGTIMFVWGIALVLIVVPLMTYVFGKRWYCSWVCGCGGLAETLGDPYRQLSDKSVRAWKIERYIIHGVLAVAVVMTAFVLYHYITGKDQILFLNAGSVKHWYGFLIGSTFSGVVGTGFYPLMGNRVWCRFGCPLAAAMGMIQRFKSRFRITTNGGQCISCGNCSTYCEMGIDVRSYAQKGQDIVRASCVGCGVCSAVCPRGVLRLENGSGDVAERTEPMRAIHITEDQIRLLS